MKSRRYIYQPATGHPGTAIMVPATEYTVTVGRRRFGFILAEKQARHSSGSCPVCLSRFGISAGEVNRQTWDWVNGLTGPDRT